MRKNYLTEQDRKRGNAPWKIPRKSKKKYREKVLQDVCQGFSLDEKSCHIRRVFKLHWAPLVGWTVTINTIWKAKLLRRQNKNCNFSIGKTCDFSIGVLVENEEDFDADYDDFDNWGDDWERHGFDCDCYECTFERDIEECGELPPHLGGGCSNAGSEYCDFECPFRDRVMNGEDDEDNQEDEPDKQ